MSKEDYVGKRAEKPSDSQSSEVSAERYRIDTLLKLGPTLPIPVKLPDGKFMENREFSFKEWDMEMEETIADMRGESENVGQFVNKLFCLLLDQFCGLDFSAMAEEQKILKINIEPELLSPDKKDELEECLKV